MTRGVFCLFVFISSFSSFSQDEFMVWTKLGVKGKIIKRLNWKVSLNTRFIPGVQTFFPQAGISYKVFKWFRPSVEYRFIVDKNKFGNLKSSGRVNFNLNFKHDVRRFYGEVRLRYQSSFNPGVSEDYDSDFDQAFRIKPIVEYKIKGSCFTPLFSAEWFLNPIYGVDRGLTKIRFAFGVGINFKGPHDAVIKYQFDKKQNYSAGLRHVASVGYSYKL